MNDFYLVVKSSIDKLAIDAATALGVIAVELDDTTNVEEALASEDDLLLFQFVDMQPEPLDPLYSLQFEIGVKTTKDSSNYDLARLLSGLQDDVTIDDTFYLRDFSTVTPPTVDEGYLYITGVQTDPQAFDGASGIRMQRVFARAVRYV